MDVIERIDRPAKTTAATGAEMALVHPPVAEMTAQAEAAAAFLKALAHEGRLMILCHLSAGEKSVTELEQLLSSRQAAVSQQLARLRLEGFVSARREGKAIYYSLSDPKVSSRRRPSLRRRTGHKPRR